jgi:DNA modification methylase
MPFMMNYGNLMKDVGFEYKGTVSWNKRSAVGGGLQSTMKRDWEMISYFAKGDARFNPVSVSRKGERVERKRISEIQDWVFSLKKAEKVGHPTQKPLALAKQILELSTKKGEKVLDCFAGSGTVGVIANEISRECVLIEADEKYVELIRERCKT